MSDEFEGFSTDDFDWGDAEDDAPSDPGDDYGDDVVWDEGARTPMLPTPTFDDYADLRERMERDRRETIEHARDEKRERVSVDATAGFSDELYVDDGDDESLMGTQRDWALSRDDRRALGIPGLRSPSRLTDRRAGRPRATSGLAHDEAAIRSVVTEHATRAGLLFAELIAPFPAGKPSPETVARRTTLAEAVRHARAEGATLDAIGRVIDRSPARVAELASQTRKKSLAY